MRFTRTFLRIGIALGALLTCAPVFGILTTVFGMGQAFRTLGESGIGDPRGLAGAVREILVASALGLFLFPFGLVLLILCMALLKRRRADNPSPVPRSLEEPGDMANKS